MSESSSLTFGLPPSLGRESVRERALAFADLLYGAGFETVVPSRDYDHLETMLRSGEVHAAWGPPLVCARLERDGGRVALRAVRDGGTTYRSALVCRDGDAIASVDDLATPPRRLRAVWVDDRSTAGYLAPRQLLRERRISPDAAFAVQDVIGSYSRCLAAVLDRSADVTATFAPAAPTPGAPPTLGGRRREGLRVLAYSAEIPNDGFVLSPALSPGRGRAVQRLIEHVLATSAGTLAHTFNADSFDIPKPGAYARVLAIAAPR